MGSPAPPWSGRKRPPGYPQLTASSRSTSVGTGGASGGLADVSREAFVADAVAAIEELALAPAVLIGQSLGGHTAFLVAAARPDLVRGLVIAEASPVEAKPGQPEEIRKLLSAWPMFPSRDAAQEFFGGDTPAARAWARNLTRLKTGSSPPSKSTSWSRRSPPRLTRAGTSGDGFRRRR